jgi:hypothetical protein
MNTKRFIKGFGLYYNNKTIQNKKDKKFVYLQFGNLKKWKNINKVKEEFIKKKYFDLWEDIFLYIKEIEEEIDKLWELEITNYKKCFYCPCCENEMYNKKKCKNCSKYCCGDCFIYCKDCKFAFCANCCLKCARCQKNGLCRECAPKKKHQCVSCNLIFCEDCFCSIIDDGNIEKKIIFFFFY